MEENISSEPKVELIPVLIADDDSPTRLLLRAAISPWGYKAIEVKDGQEAWEKMQEPNSPRLLIIDWLMPNLSGIELCEKIKRKDPNVYIILLTQQTGAENTIKGLEAGADEFLSKPFNMAELKSRLQVGRNIIRYQEALNKKNVALEKSQSEMQALLARFIQLAEEFDGMSSDQRANKIAELKTTIEKMANNLKDTIAETNRGL